MGHSLEKKVLRVGLIHNGRIVEERLFRKPGNISVGSSKSALFSVPGAGLPEKREVFVVKKGRYHLACGDDLNFRVTSAGSTSERRAPRADDSRLTPHAPHLPTPLSEDAHGRVQIGEVTLLFQFVTAPPAPPKLQLPEMTMVRWSSRVDRSFAAIFSWVVLMHVGVVMAVQSAPLPKEPVGIVDDRGNIIEVFVKPPAKPVEDGNTPNENNGAKETPQPTKAPKPTVKIATGGGGPIDIGKLRESVRTRGVIAAIASRESGSALDRMFHGDAVRPEDVLDGTAIASSTLENAVESGRIKSGTADGGPVTIGELETGGTMNSENVSARGTGGEKKEVILAGRIGLIDVEPPQVEGCLEPAKIAAVVKARLRSLQDCYEKELKKNPSLAGKLTIGFTIDGEGVVSETHVEANTMGNPVVADCISNRIRRFKFPKSDCSSVPVSYPFVFVKTQ